MVMPEDDAGIVALLRVNIPYAAPLSLLAANRIEAQAAEIEGLQAEVLWLTGKLAFREGYPND
jgi:hypothetical protein